MARPKKAKQRHEPESIAHTLDELESTGDKITQWVIDNPVPILAGIGGVLAVAAVFGVVQGLGESGREAASASLGAVQADYRRAMGASPDDIIVPEPANPEVAREVREEYVGRFAEVSEEYPGTAAGGYASLEAGILQDELGEREQALETWKAAAARGDSSSAMTALLELRVAAAEESAGRWVEAGEAYERAAAVRDFPLRHTARAEAARCFAEAGDVERALAAFEQVKRDDPDGFLPEHLEARLLELQIAQRLD